MLGEVRKYRHHEYVKRSGVGVSDFIAGIIELSLHYYEELGFGRVYFAALASTPSLGSLA